MSKRIAISCILAVLCGHLFVGCAQVKPWEKGHLAKPHMAFDPDPVEARFVRHVQDSKEGTSGGYGVQISGCGCN